MLEVDPECSCVNFNDGESKWKRRRELDEAADSIEGVLRNSLTEIETKLAESDDDMLVVQPKPKRLAIAGNDNLAESDDMLVVQPKPKRLAIAEDDNLLWCNRVCVYEKVMDSAVWCTTPPTIMELVFARLPLDRIFQMRCLSKHWQASIMSPSFQHAFSTTTSWRFAFISGLDNRRIWSYGIRERKWYAVRFAFLPMYCASPVAEDGGLLCSLRRAIPIKRLCDLELYVCNPLTQAWRKLPLPSQVERFDLVHLVTDPQTKQYTITAVSDVKHNSDQSYQSWGFLSKTVMEVYNSATKTWNASSKGIFQSAGNNLVYYKKYVYQKFVGIRVYDQTTGYSTSIPFDFLEPIIHSEMMGYSTADMPCALPLTVYQGLVYMLRTEEEDMEMNGVWVLRPPNHVWEKLYSVPNPEVLQFYHFSLIACVDVIAIFGDGTPGFRDKVGADSEEDLVKPYFWMLDRAQETWIDMADHKLDHFTWSEIVLQMRLDAIP